MGLTIQDDINAVATADSGVATAQQGVVSARASLTSAQAQVTTAQAADQAADQQLSADLQSGGPVYITNADGTVSVYAYSTSSPGYTLVKASPAGSVNSVSPAPTPSPTS
jgi:hypothetical protein